MSNKDSVLKDLRSNDSSEPEEEEMWEDPFPEWEEQRAPHLSCASYPNCDVNPNGCSIENREDAEPYGHRD